MRHALNAQEMTGNMYGAQNCLWLMAISALTMGAGSSAGPGGQNTGAGHGNMPHNARRAQRPQASARNRQCIRLWLRLSVATSMPPQQVSGGREVASNMMAMVHRRRHQILLPGPEHANVAAAAESMAPARCANVSSAN